MEARAMYDFRAQQEDELSFQRNDILKILQTDEDENWYRAELNGQIGYVPKNRVQRTQVRWYMGVVSRNEAERILMARNLPDGSFLVRDSESTPGDFSLSVKFQNTVEHYRVLRDTGGKYFLWVVKFNSLNELIEYHTTHTISRSQNIMLRINEVPHEIPPNGPGGHQMGGPHGGHMGGPPIQNQAPPQGDRFQAVTAYRFVGEEDNELSFEANETIYVYVNYEGRYNLNEPWWYGEINRQGRGGVRGLFPSNYITVTDQVRQRYRIRTPTGAGY